MSEKNYVVYSHKHSRNHGNNWWYGPNCNGYQYIYKAGRYTKEEADKACENNNGSVEAVQIGSPRFLELIKRDDFDRHVWGLMLSIKNLEEERDQALAQVKELESDKTRLDWLQAQNTRARYTGWCTFRTSHTGRGWRFHEHTSGHLSVRGALDDAIAREAVTDAAH